MPAKNIHERGRNLLLATMPPDERERLRTSLQSVLLDEGQVLIEPFTPIRHVYFPLSGAVSLVMPAGQSQLIEAGMVGNEGVVGVCLSLGSDRAPMRAVVQTSCHALRMSAKAFGAEMQRNGPLADAVHLYAQSYMVMLAQGLVCIRAHPIEQRCARWLIMLHDRAYADQFRLTQQTLARMLGVRRATVSEVASRLQKRGLVRYERGVMNIVDRAGLERAACECYGVVRRELARLLAVPLARRRKPLLEKAATVTQE
jgi:CRP-like cAMP-binding protein